MTHARAEGRSGANAGVKNVFVVGPEEMHWKELATVEGAGTQIRFHPLLTAEQVVDAPTIRIVELLREARQQLDRFDGTVDAIIAHWDFPTTLLVPILCAERGLRAPSVDAVLRCSHKYWSRMAQQEAVPEMTPRFELVDPFADDAADIGLDYPFWLKPVKGYASQLGFRIDDRKQLDQALDEIRGAIERLAKPFDRLLEEAGVSEELRSVGGRHCLAEEYLGGIELAHEGYVQGGRTTVHGTLHMVREGETFSRFLWPAHAPRSVLERMSDASARLLSHIGFDDSGFNAEFFWDEAEDRLTFIEVNPRISQSHSPLAMWVDGRSNHEVAVDVALGKKPRFTPGAGSCHTAAKFMERTEKDGTVEHVPTEEELEALRARHPRSIVHVKVEEGKRLSEFLGQDAYTYKFAEIYLGCSEAPRLLEEHAALIEELPLRIDGVRLPEDLVGNRVEEHSTAEQEVEDG